MDDILTAMENLDRNLGTREQRFPLSFEEFLEVVVANPYGTVRNVFQVFHDMVKSYVGEGREEYPEDAEATHFVYYDCSRLFVEGADHPFFADRLFAYRLIGHVEALKHGAQQNKIYVFDGPPGCGKSTFLNNLLMKFEEYTSTEAGLRYETVWRLDRKLLGGVSDSRRFPLLERLAQELTREADISLEGSEIEPDVSFADEPENYGEERGAYPPHLAQDPSDPYFSDAQEDYIEVPCPSHDHPILMIPKAYRRSFFDDLLKNNEFKWKLSTEKEYEWVFRDAPCTICSSLYQALLHKLGCPRKVFEMIYARPYRFNRRLGEGISVFNPGDKPLRQNVFTNGILQRRINKIFRESTPVQYIFSRYAKTNNGIYALMDIKSHNTERLIELHNIVSEGVHKVEDIEENVNSLFLAVMNPEDEKNIQSFESFSDRIEYINIPYVLDLKTEIEIYRNIFGKQIDERFLPRVLRNFARVIVSSRLNTHSEALLEWIGKPDKYRLYCDQNLQLLKMEIYMGEIPPWLSEEDRKKLTAKRRRKILAESNTEGRQGFSGRDSIKIFNDFYSTFGRKDKLIDMSILCNYFTKIRPDLSELIPEGFLDSLLDMYNYKILQEVKESLYNYNEEQISRDIQNYLFALNFEVNTEVSCTFTGDKLEINNAFFESIEHRLLGTNVENQKRLLFRRDTQKEYTSRTLTQEIMVEGKPIIATTLYHELYERYVYNLKEKVLDPFLENENFRRAIKDYNQEGFKTYDKRIRDDVVFLIHNLCEKFHYTEQGAKEICIYVIDSNLAQAFANA